MSQHPPNAPPPPSKPPNAPKPQPTSPRPCRASSRVLAAARAWRAADRGYDEPGGWGRLMDAIKTLAAAVDAEDGASVSHQQHEEWRVTGKPRGYPPYDFTWSTGRGDDDPEQAARSFVALFDDDNNSMWQDGPHLSRRTVTITEWERVEP